MGWALQLKATENESRTQRPLDTVLFWVEGMDEMTRYYKKNLVRPPPGIRGKGWRVTSSHLTPLIGRQREWIQKCSECAEYLRKPLVRRRCRTVNRVCTDKHAGIIVGHAVPNDADADFTEVEEANEGDWSIESLHRVLKKAEALEKESVKRKERRRGNTVFVGN